jgi:hypothetical protein
MSKTITRWIQLPGTPFVTDCWHTRTTTLWPNCSAGEDRVDARGGGRADKVSGLSGMPPPFRSAGATISVQKDVQAVCRCGEYGYAGEHGTDQPAGLSRTAAVPR